MESMEKINDEEMVNKAVKEHIDKQSKATEIKKCPFCGGHASVSVSTRNSPSGLCMFAKCECDDCHAIIGVSQSEVAEFVKELCIAKWNRRVAGDMDVI